MTTFVLVPGAFRGAWAWSRVAPLLRDAGHAVVTVELIDPQDPERGLDEHIADLVVQVRAADVEDAVLVGHSQGGFLARVMAQELEDVLAAVAYLDAPVPRDGERAIDLVPGGAVGTPPRDLVISPPPPRDTEDENARWIAARVQPQAVALSLDPVDLDELELPTFHAFCADTPDTYPAATTRGRLDEVGAPYVTLAAGHDAPVTDPALVAGWLLDIAAELAAR